MNKVSVRLKRSASYLLAILGVAALFCLPGCGTPKFEQGGAYNVVVGTNSDGTLISQSDPLLYASDSTFNLLADSMGAIFDAEKDNRAYFWALSPQIKHTLDKIRPDAVKAKNAYLDARKAYIKNPTPAGITGLQQYLNELSRISDAVSAAFPKHTTPPAVTH